MTDADLTEAESLAGHLHAAEAADVAQRRGWLHREHHHELAQSYVGPPFGHGQHLRVHNVVQGDIEGLSITAFDYHYLVVAESDADRYDRSMRQCYLVVVIDLDVAVPCISATESEWSDWAPRGGPVEVEFERFRRHYTVSAEDAALARAILTTEVMERIVDRLRATEWRIEDNRLVCWAKSQHVGHDLEDLLEVLWPVIQAAREFARGAA